MLRIGAAAETMMLASFKRINTPAGRSEASIARRNDVGPGERWSIDFLPTPPTDVDGYTSGLLMVYQASRYLHLVKLKAKSTDALVAALKTWRRDLAAAHPEVRKITIRGDSDPAWTVSKRGDDTLPALLGAWLRT